MNGIDYVDLLKTHRAGGFVFLRAFSLHIEQYLSIYFVHLLINLFIIKVSSLHGLHTPLQLMSYKLWIPNIRRNAVSYDTCTFRDTKGQVNYI